MSMCIYGNLVRLTRRISTLVQRQLSLAASPWSSLCPTQTLRLWTRLPSPSLKRYPSLKKIWHPQNYSNVRLKKPYVTEKFNEHTSALSKMVKGKQHIDIHLYNRVAAKEHWKLFTFVCSLLVLVLDVIMDCSLEPAKTTPPTWRLSPVTHAPWRCISMRRSRRYVWMTSQTGWR